MENFYSTARSNVATAPRDSVSEETDVIYFPSEGWIQEMQVVKGLEQRLSEK